MVVNDSIVEPDETFTVTLSNVMNAVISDATATGTITNDDTAAETCTLNTGDLWCGEVTVGTSGDGVGFVAADPDVAADTDVGALTDNDGDQTITIGSDSYTISSLLVLSTPAGTLAITLDTKFPTSDVATLEFYIGSKTFKVSEASVILVGHGYYWLASDLTWTDGGPDATLRLRRAAEEEALPELSVANAEADESAAGVAFTLTLSAAATDNVTATWTASIETGDSAEAADFGSPLTGTATFTPSQTAVTITVPTIDDSTDEDDDTFTLTLSSPSANATLASDATATGTITDNDDPPTISVQDQTVIEGDQEPG